MDQENSHNHPTISVKIYSRGAENPVYESSHASGCDLRAAIPAQIEIASLERLLIPTGLFVEIPAGYEAQIRPRSGQALKKGLGLPNSPGTIDADYRGEIKVLVINFSREKITIIPNERIAQMIFTPVVQAMFQNVTSPAELKISPRDSGGFGSTGV